MRTPIVSLDQFELPFTTAGDDEVTDAAADCDEELDELDRLQALIPEEAIYLGTVDSEMDNWRSWKIEDHFYLLALHDQEFEWALFRISWDDNWETFDWSCDARASGLEEANEASRFLLKALFESWGIDLTKSDTEPYAAFLSEI